MEKINLREFVKSLDEINSICADGFWRYVASVNLRRTVRLLIKTFALLFFQSWP
jgi:hypothetical protein